LVTETAKNSPDSAQSPANSSANTPGTLYVVATPIGNLEDLGPRARRILSEVDLIAAEDTRMTSRLLDHCAIRTPLTPVHDHNERQRAPALVRQLRDGADVALVSDAGTPLISDPGHVLVREAIAAGIVVVPIAGPSAIITALSAAGLAVNRFSFEGFVPPKHGARISFYDSLKNDERTLVFYESPRRIGASLADLLAVVGPDRPVCIARELTKAFESFYRGTLGELVEADLPPREEQRGEFVLIVEGAQTPAESSVDDATLGELVAVMPVRQAVDIVVRLTGDKRNAVYERALALRDASPESE